MPERTFTIEGDEQLIQTLLDAAEASGDFSGVNGEVADIVANNARTITPVITGELRDGTDAASDETASVVLNGVEYAPVIHNGWPEHHISAQPFLDDAFEHTMSSWMGLYHDRVVEIVQMVEGA